MLKDAPPENGNGLTQEQHTVALPPTHHQRASASTIEEGKAKRWPVQQGRVNHP